MKTAPTIMQNNPDVKRAVIAFQQPQARQFKRGQYHTYKLHTTPADATSPIYELSVPFFDNGTPEEWIKFWCELQVVLKGQNITQGPPSYVVDKTLLKEHMFPKKAGQTQKCYMRMNLWIMGGMTMKEWVAQVSELNGYLKDFSTHNKNKIQLLDDDKLLDILEYGVPASWRRVFTKLCEPSLDKLKDKKSPRSRIAGKRNADTPTKPAGEKKFYCNMHGRNKTHTTEDCFELKRHTKRAKPNETQTDADKVTYKDLNAFVNAKVTAALNKAKKNLKTEERKRSQA
eukprot:3694773-Ditylum_brightwellii.AAC.1